MKVRPIVVAGIVCAGLLAGLGHVGSPSGGRNGIRGPATAPSGPTGGPRVDWLRLPLSFEENVGQTSGPAKFIARGSAYSLFLESNEAILTINRSKAGCPASLKIGFEGADRSAVMTAEKKLAGVSNYFLGSDPAGWRTRIPQFARVRAAGVYPGIDLVYYGNQQELEFDLVAQPGADPGRIVMKLEGAGQATVDSDGDLLAEIGDQQLRLRRPRVYQGSIDHPQEVEGRYLLLADDRVGFEVGSYNRTQPLVIDPSIVYATYYGSGGYDMFSKIAVDGAGNLYFEGSTNATNFPTKNALHSTYLGGLFDVFIGKLNPAGDTVLFSTYFGGNGRDTGSGIAVDADGDIYITGDTDSANFPLLGAIQTTFGGNGAVGFGDAFLTKMKSDGTALIYSTYLGGNGDDLAMGIAVDADKNAYVTGVTESSNFPVANAFQGTRRGTGDMFVSKVNPGGTGFVYSTYLGGSGVETSYGFGSGGIAATSDGQACVVGYTNSTDFPLANAYQSTYAGAGTNKCGDAFVAKLNAAGSTLVFSTYLGGSNDDLGSNVAVDPAGNVYIAGKTKSSNFPTLNPFQGTFGGGGADGFVASFGPDGALRYSTFFGWSTYDSVADITVNDNGNAFIVGGIDVASLPTVDPIQATMNGPGDAYISVFAADGLGLAFSTYLGGTGGDSAGNIRLDSGGNMYIAGGASAGFPVKNAVMPDPPSADGGLFLAKVEGVSFIPGPILTSLDPASASAGDAGFSLAVLGSGFKDGAVVRWNGSERTTTFISDSQVDAEITTADLVSGKSVQITVRNPDTGVSNALTFAINNPVPVLTSISPAVATGGCAGLDLTVTGSHFVPNSVVTWNGTAAATTTFVSVTELTAAVGSSCMATPGDAQVAVVNPAPSGGTSAAAVFTVSGYAVSASPSSVTITAGQSATYTLQLAPEHGSFDVPITFSCVGLPSKCTSTFSPATVTPGASNASTTLTLKTTGSSGSAAGSMATASSSWPPASALLVLALTLMAGWSRIAHRRVSYRLVAAFVVALAILAVGSCSSGGGDNNQPTGTPKGTYTITAQAVSGTLRVTTPVTLIVQ